MKLYLSPYVFCREIEGLLIIFDLGSEAYYAFDAVATFMWNTLLTADNQNEALEILQAKYSVGIKQVRIDFEQFRLRCLEQGWLSEQDVDRRKDEILHIDLRYPKSLTLSAWWSLFRTERSLSGSGLSQTYQTYASIARPKKNRNEDERLLIRCVTAFAMAENFFLIKSAPNDCLPRSLALFRFLRSVGLAAEHCIGVRQFPFGAHAWVEYRGRVVHDDPSRQDIFTVIARISE